MSSLVRRLDRLGFQYAARLARALDTLVAGLSDEELNLLASGPADLEDVTDAQLERIVAGGDLPRALHLEPLSAAGEALAEWLEATAVAMVAAGFDTETATWPTN